MHCAVYIPGLRYKRPDVPLAKDAKGREARNGEGDTATTQQPPAPFIVVVCEAAAQPASSDSEQPAATRHQVKGWWC